MKTNNLFGIWLLFLCATVLSGCNNYLLNGKDGDEEEDNEEVWYNNIPEGNFFSRGNTLRFYYIDEKGNDLINPSDLKTFLVERRAGQSARTHLRQHPRYRKQHHPLQRQSQLDTL